MHIKKTSLPILMNLEEKNKENKIRGHIMLATGNGSARLRHRVRGETVRHKDRLKAMDI